MLSIIKRLGLCLTFSLSGCAVLDTHDKSVHRIYPGSDSSIASEELWGEASCTKPGEAFQAHGIDLRQRSDGRWQLLVVNHGSRESVEFFELEFGEEDRTRAIWWGCVVMPDQASINDVAALPDGGFLVTHIADKDNQMWQLLLSFFGRNTGFAVGAGTVAVELDGFLDIGSYVGDRIIKIAVPAGA